MGIGTIPLFHARTKQAFDFHGMRYRFVTTSTHVQYSLRQYSRDIQLLTDQFIMGWLKSTNVISATVCVCKRFISLVLRPIFREPARSHVKSTQEMDTGHRFCRNLVSTYLTLSNELACPGFLSYKHLKFPNFVTRQRFSEST